MICSKHNFAIPNKNDYQLISTSDNHQELLVHSCPYRPASTMKSRKQKRFPEPTPSRTVLGTGAGWGYGCGCGVGPFLGMGISALPGTVLFGAGAGVGAYCGVGFGTGIVMGIGSFYVPYGIISRDLFHPHPSVKAFVSNVQLQLRMLLVSFFEHTRLGRITNSARFAVPQTRLKSVRNVCERRIDQRQLRLTLV